MNAWMCNRCGTASREGNVDVPPTGWRFASLPVRGSGDARSLSHHCILCADCDDSLYEWVHDTRRAERVKSFPECWVVHSDWGVHAIADRSRPINPDAIAVLHVKPDGTTEMEALS